VIEEGRRYARVAKRVRVPSVSAMARHYGMPGNWRETVAGLDLSAEVKEERERLAKRERVRQVKEERERAAMEEMKRAAKGPDDMDWETEEEGEEAEREGENRIDEDKGKGVLRTEEDEDA
jgi:hypothetical protein